MRCADRSESVLPLYFVIYYAALLPGPLRQPGRASGLGICQSMAGPFSMSDFAPAPIGQKAQPAAVGRCKTAKAVTAKGARAQARALSALVDVL